MFSKLKFMKTYLWTVYKQYENISNTNASKFFPYKINHFAFKRHLHTSVTTDTFEYLLLLENWKLVRMISHWQPF